MATGGRAEAVRVSPLATRRPDVPVEVLAARTLSLATLGPRRRAERLQESVAELEAITSGTYGVMAAAKAAAPAIAEHVAELAGGKKAPDGQRVGRAKRDADCIRAADLVLTISGDKIERQASLHLELLDGLSDHELEMFSTRGEWPERLHGVGGLIEPPAGPALSTAGSGPPAGPVNTRVCRSR